jgi:hypothetical protein
MAASPIKYKRMPDSIPPTSNTCSDPAKLGLNIGDRVNIDMENYSNETPKLIKPAKYDIVEGTISEFLTVKLKGSKDDICVVKIDFGTTDIKKYKLDPNIVFNLKDLKKIGATSTPPTGSTPPPTGSTPPPTGSTPPPTGSTPPPTGSTPPPATGSTPPPATGSYKYFPDPSKVKGYYNIIDYLKSNFKPPPVVTNGDELKKDKYIMGYGSNGFVGKLSNNVSKTTSTSDSYENGTLEKNLLNSTNNYKISKFKKGSTFILDLISTNETDFLKLVKEIVDEYNSIKSSTPPSSTSTTTTTSTGTTTTIPTGPVISPGIANLGIYCYAISAIQALYHIPQIRDAILSFNPGGTRTDQIDYVLKLKELFEMLDNNKGILNSTNPPIGLKRRDVEDIFEDTLIPFFIRNVYNDSSRIKNVSGVLETLDELYARQKNTTQDSDDFFRFILFKILDDKSVKDNSYKITEISNMFSLNVNVYASCVKKDSTQPFLEKKTEVVTIYPGNINGIDTIQEAIDSIELPNTRENTSCIKLADGSESQTFYEKLSFPDSSEYLIVRIREKIGGTEENPVINQRPIEPSKIIKIKTEDNKLYEFKLNGVICYPAGHYYYYYFDDSGKTFLYNDSNVSIVDINNKNQDLYTRSLLYIYKLKDITSEDEKLPSLPPQPIIDYFEKIKDRDGNEITIAQECQPGDPKKPCPLPFTLFPRPPPNINERETLYYNLMNSTINTNYLQKVRKEDFYYVLKKFKDIDNKVEETAYLNMLSYYMKERKGQWVNPDIIARECWMLYIKEYLHEAITSDFENDRMLKLIFFLMRYVEDPNLYIDEPGNPSGKIHIIPYLYMYFRNPSLFAIKQKGGKNIMVLMNTAKFTKIMFGLKLLEINMLSPIYQNEAYLGYNKDLIDKATNYSKEKPMKTVIDYCVNIEIKFKNLKYEGDLLRPLTIQYSPESLLLSIIGEYYDKFRNEDLIKILNDSEQKYFIKKTDIITFAYLLDDTTLAFGISGYPTQKIVDTGSLAPYVKEIKDYDKYNVNLETLIRYKCDNILKIYIPRLSPYYYEFENRELVTAINCGSFETFETLLKEQEFPITYFTVNRILFYLKKYKDTAFPGFNSYYQMLGLIINYGVRFDKFQENVIRNLGQIKSQELIEYEYYKYDGTKEKVKANTYYAYFMKKYGDLKLQQKICGTPNNAGIPLNIKEKLYSLGINVEQSNQKICQDLISIRTNYSEKNGNIIESKQIVEKALEQTRKYLLNIIPNFNLKSGNAMLTDKDSWNANDYKDEKLEGIEKYNNMYGFDCYNPLRYNTDTLVWYQVEEEIQKKQKSQENKEEGEETQKQQKGTKRIKTYIYPAYRFQTLINTGINEDGSEIPIDVINRMKNKLDYFDSNKFLVSNIELISGMVRIFFVELDRIDNEESEYIFNSILRLVQSYGHTYNDLISLNVSVMSELLIRCNIIINESTNRIFKELKTEPLKEQFKQLNGPNFENPVEDNLIDKVDSQHITFFIYLYMLFETNPHLIEDSINFLFSRNRNRFM